MRLPAMAFLLGVLCLHQLPTLPSVSWAWSLILIGVFYRILKRSRWLLALPLGFFWALLQAHWQLAPGLDPRLEGEDLLVEGVVASVPQDKGRFTRFLFEPNSVQVPGGIALDPPRLVRLSWYAAVPELRPGDRWRLRVRMKRPNGFMNPGGFDYEGWLYRQGIQATGYVRTSAQNRHLSSKAGYPVERLRQRLAEDIGAALAEGRNRGVITALAVGLRDHIPAEQWQLFLDTGTNHLVAISGLHIGLVAGLVYLLVSRVVRFFPRLCERWAAARIAAVAALLAAATYAMLAGFAIPTQRALIMLSVVMGAVLLGRVTVPSQVLSAALLAVLAIDTQAVLSAGFWLSFGAVAVIVYSMAARPTQRRFRWGRLQLTIALGLLPVTLWFFQRGALAGPLANLVAVPWVSLLVVPLTLAGVFFVSWWPAPGEALLGLADLALEPLWWVLGGLQAQPWAQWTQHQPSYWAFLAALLAVGLLLAPRGLPSRWVGAVLLAPMVLTRPQPPPHGEAWFTLLDVGQGLAAIVQTRHHSLVFDTGPRFSERFDTGSAVVLPFLRSRGIRTLDTVVISHGDNDHVGGAASVLREVPVERVLSSVPESLDHPLAQACVAGQHWQWDGVWFEILHPAQDTQASENDLSCVLRIRTATNTLLLTGDIEREAERHLVQRYGPELASDVVLVPHHGSRTSSSTVLIDTVRPKLALVAAGYRNRYGFPKEDVMRRYQARGIAVLNTADLGAIGLRLRTDGCIDVDEGYRTAHRRYWNRITPLPSPSRRICAPERIEFAVAAEPAS